MTEKKETVKQTEAVDLWQQMVEPIPLKKYVKDAGDTENILVFSETGAGKTRFYLLMLEYFLKKGRKNILTEIIYPDRPQGLAKLYGLIPKEYTEMIDIYPTPTYEQMIISTATAVKKLMKHYDEVGKHGMLVYELLENYWTFSQDYFSRQAYGQNLGEYFAQMQSIMSKDKADKKTAYEAFSGPWGGPWPIIKFMHNFNWLDKIKRMPFHKVFTAELKEEDNKDSIFYELGFRPAGEKHNQHKVDTILYLSHKGNNFFMKPYKLTGYTKLYGELNITGKNGYEEHIKACKRLEELGYKISKMEDLEKQAGIKPPIKKAEPKPKPETKKEEKTVETISKTDEGEKTDKMSKEELTKKPEKAKEKKVEKKEVEEEDEWTI